MSAGGVASGVCRNRRAAERSHHCAADKNLIFIGFSNVSDSKQHYTQEPERVLVVGNAAIVARGTRLSDVGGTLDDRMCRQKSLVHLEPEAGLSSGRTQPSLPTS